MKKVLSLVLVLTMVLSSFTFAFAAPASDVAGTEYENAVETLNVLGILQGYTDGTFKPGNSITRAEFAAVVVRALGQEKVATLATTATRFSDVPVAQWYTGYVNVATNLKIVNGYPDGSFKPQNPVSYEEAVTMMMRALGYEPEAAQKGGYPLGYLLVAGDAGVTRNVDGVMNAPATRGIVAQLTNNALTVPMMVAVEFGSGVKYVKAGDNDTDYKDLLGNFLDANLLETKKDNEVRIEDIARHGTKEGYVKIAGKTYKLEKFAKDVDVEALFGAKVKAWVNNDDEVLRIQLDDTPLHDAIYVNEDGDGVELYDAGDEYDLAKNVSVFINGVKKKVADLNKDSDYAYAKLSLNRDGDVAFLEVFEWENFMIVEKVDKDEVKGFGDHLSAKDFTVVKEGKKIALEDLVEGDVLFYNAHKDAKFAEVYNSSSTGEVGRIYTDRVQVDKSLYTFKNAYLGLNAKYLNEKEDISLLEADVTLTKDVLEAMQDAGKVTVFVDRFGAMVYLTGDIKDLKTTSSYFVLYNNVTEYESRNVTKYAFDTVNSEGKKVTFDVLDTAKIYKENGNAETWTNVVKADTKPTTKTTQSELLRGDVVELVLDKDGDVKEVKLVDDVNLSPAIKADQKYFAGKKLASDTVVFLAERFDGQFKPADLAVELFGKLSFDNINNGKVYVQDGKVVAIYATDTSRNTDQVYMTVSTSTPNKDANKDIFRLRLVIDGVRDFFFTKENPTLNNLSNVKTDAVAGTFLEVGMNKDKTEVTSIQKIDAVNRIVSGKIDSINVSAGTVTIAGTVVKLGSDAAVVDGADLYKVIRFSDLRKGDTVKALLVEAGSPYAEVILRTLLDGETGNENTNTVTGTVYDVDRYTVKFQVSTDSSITKGYEITADTVYEAADGTLSTGLVAVRNALTAAKAASTELVIDIIENTLKLDWIRVK